MRIGEFRRAFALGISAALLSLAPALAVEPPFAITHVPAGDAGAAGEVDAGVALAGARFVRLSASGILQSPYARSACPRITADGCSAGFVSGKTVYAAPAGALLAKFVDDRGGDVVPWAVAGRLAVLTVPSRARRLVYRINGAGPDLQGAYRVVSDAVGNAGTPDRASPLALGRRTGDTVRTTAPVPRWEIQMLLRRFGFSDTPVHVDAALREGIPAWLDSQLKPLTIDDAAAATTLIPDPILFESRGVLNYDRFANEAQLAELECASKRQLLEKLTLHWLEHFSVSRSKSQPAFVAHYIATLRRDALGNFTQLLIDVAKEPAMLDWLDNEENSAGAGASANENFARELLQLFVMGTTELNPDGTVKLDARGQPLPNYSQSDVTALATAMTGYVGINVPVLGTDPAYDLSTTFQKWLHGRGPYVVFGKTLADPGDGTVLDAAIRFVVHNNDSIAPFEATELLQRFATESPSPAYVARIAAVWQRNIDAPDQIAQVVRAIVLDPEFFPSGRGALVKEPIEYVLDMYRALPVTRVQQTSRLEYSMHDLVAYRLPPLGQSLYAPPSVFSFYRPGAKETLLTDSALLMRWQYAARFVRGDDPDFALDHSALTKAAGGSQPDRTITYLCDALVDGGTPQLRALLENYLTGPSADLSAALWLILISPEYEVN